MKHWGRRGTGWVILAGMMALLWSRDRLVSLQGGPSPEVFQVVPSRLDALPGGKEADGILGDWVLRNERVEVLVAAPGEGRKAHLTSGRTSGALLDATLRGAHNDQFGILFPGGKNWAMDRAIVVEDGRHGEAILRLVKEATAEDPLFVATDYSLRAGEPWLKVSTLLVNRGEKSLPQAAMDLVRIDGLFEGPAGTLPLAYAYDPYERAAYGIAVAKGQMEVQVQQSRRALVLRYGVPSGAEGVLGPKESVRFTRYFLIGETPAEILHLAQLLRGEPMGALHGIAVDREGKPIDDGRVECWPLGGDLSPLYKPVLTFTDPQGHFRAWLPPGRWRVQVRSLGRSDGDQEVSIQKGRTGSIYQVLSPQTRFLLEVRDTEGRPLPCKVQFIGLEGTPDPDFGPIERADGARNIVLSAQGSFSRSVSPGKYRLVVSRGTEYDAVVLEKSIDLGQALPVRVTLKRTVNTQGWVAADLHSHTTESGDNTTAVPDRLIAHAAEGVEFIPATDHNRLVDWEPFIRRLGLTPWLKTTVGIESTGGGPHLNIFPLTPRPFTQDNGAPQWDPDPRVVARRFREAQPLQERYIQLNHPDMGVYFNDRNADGQPDGGFEGLEKWIDGVELYGTAILGQQALLFSKQGDKKVATNNRVFNWLQFLNRGHRYVAVGNTDAHQVYHQCGFPRNYIPSSTDNPPEIRVEEMVRHLKARHVVMTNGPFLETRLNGFLPGDEVKAKEGTLWVRVQCPNWFDVDRVQILFNGREVPELNFTRRSHPHLFRAQGAVRFQHRLPLHFAQDTHVIVVAIGEESNLGLVGGPGRATTPPVAIANPFFVDVEGDGFEPNGDPLVGQWPTAPPRG